MAGRVQTESRAADRVYGRLLEWISSGRLPRGNRVKIQEVADALGVSATPVREAISLLVRDGVLTFEPHRGASVRDYSPEEVGQLSELRALLEGLAARRAVRSHERDTLIEKLREQIVLMRDAIDRLDRPAYNRYDLTFHELIFSEGSDGFIRQYLRVPELLARVFSAMKSEDCREIAALRRSDRAAISEFKKGVAHHRRLLDAIAAGDADRAEKVAREHSLRFLQSKAHRAGRK